MLFVFAAVRLLRPVTIWLWHSWPFAFLLLVVPPHGRWAFALFLIRIPFLEVLAFRLVMWVFVVKTFLVVFLFAAPNRVVTIFLAILIVFVIFTIFILTL